ncbi:MAG: gliding motility protein GldL [Prevotellaceae bacterium]|jgi:gliding motility-associated protein GldL|nr:gliding motility protein GldL [Prevotellaceae bacterium]
MANTQTTAVKKPSKFAIWYNSNAGQRTVAAFYSVGASIVILGALFKIMHWPAAGYVLSTGMITEAVLFFIGVFEKPHKNYHWENVYPSLMGERAEPVAIGGSSVFGASLKDEDAKKLEAGIKQLSETAGKLGNISSAAVATEAFGKTLTDATSAVSSFTTKQQNLDEVSAGMIRSYQEISSNLINVSEGTKIYASNTDNLQKSMSAINSVYELELKNIQSQAEAINTQAQAINAQTGKITSASSDMERLFATVNATAKDMETYKQQTEKLAKHVSDLNSVYGNMLNAIRS